MTEGIAGAGFLFKYCPVMEVLRLILQPRDTCKLHYGTPELVPVASDMETVIFTSLKLFLALSA